MYTDIQYSTSNPSSGAGAKQSWTSKKGNGAMEITESTPNKEIKMTLRFEGFDKPMLGDFQFEPVANGTKVTWTDKGSMGNNPFYKYMGLMMNSMIGGNMEKSFENVKKLCE
ncbi:Polyketide cyclase / dehydrase and lipid transport [compost metagenome]